ncbi:MAG: alpha/beta fold hydrolase [Rhizomicrobium sp.]
MSAEPSAISGPQRRPDLAVGVAVAPGALERDAVRATIVECLSGIWSRTLQTSPILPESDFFDLGGDSLLAVGLLLEIEQEFGQKFPITTIYDAPTVAEQADLIESGQVAKFSPLVLLKPGEGGSPLFIVHGIGGTVIELAALGKQIRTDGPVYAIQARGIDGSEPPIDSVAEMAAYYLDAIRPVQPVGPWLLAGYSFGGLVALEMARLLGEENVALLFMIDSYALPQTWPLKSRLTRSVRRWLNRLRLLATLPLGESAAKLTRRLDRLTGRGTAGTAGTAAGVASNPARHWLGEPDPALPLSLQQVHHAGIAALTSYVPKHYPGRIIFLKAGTTEVTFPTDPANIWSRLAGAFALHMAPGDHASMIHAHSDRVADCISANLPQALPLSIGAGGKADGG